MNSFCHHYNALTCRSCPLIGNDYLEQLQMKEQELRESLAESSRVNFLPTVPSALHGFRNKAKLIVTGTIEKPIIGLAGEDNLDQGRELLDCPLHHPQINALLKLVKSFITRSKLQPYSIKEKKGELKGLILFYSQGSEEMYLRLVLRSQEPVSRIKKYMNELLADFPPLVCLSVNLQPIPHALLEGEEEIILTERTYVEHRLENINLRIGPRAFVQTNQVISSKLYETAARWVENLKIKKFLELYSGQGAFSFSVAPFVEQALGVEINSSAVTEANRTAKEKGYQHVTFKCQDATEVEQELKDFIPELVLVNPPRRGLGKSVELLLTQAPEYVIYSSCSHLSLGEDLQKMSSVYEVRQAQIFDMFPHTHHFETLVLLTKK